MKIRDRIKDLRRVKASELLPNPKNWRQHPSPQADAMRGILAEIGFADATLARETPNGVMLIDGHLRAEVAPDAQIPVLVLDVTEAEADRILATHDPIAEMATADAEKLGDLLDGMEWESPAVQEMLEDLAENSGFFDVDEVESAELPSGDRSPIRQMTFTVSDDQEAEVQRALAEAKDVGPFVDTGNENSNGNALARISEAYRGAS